MNRFEQFFWAFFLLGTINVFAQTDACLALEADSIKITTLEATTATINWFLKNADQVQMEYGEEGFELGNGHFFRTTEDSLLLENLMENTRYEFYLSRVCGQDSLSSAIGPFTFKTTFLVPPDTCVYNIQFVDFFGDGWNGASLTISVNGESETYSLIDSTLGFLEVKALKNWPLQIIFNEGPFDEEISYIVYDPDGVFLFSDGPSPNPGLAVDLIACPSCPLPAQINIDESANAALVAWESVDAIDHYLIEYGLDGFSRGSGLFIRTRDTFVQIPDLQEFTKYDFYLSAICTENDSSRTVRVDSFATRYAKDVGIDRITMPATACGLTNAEMIEIQLKNFGANPQSLIPFRFSVNGMDGEVAMPADGFYTDILSKEAFVTIAFETIYDFSQIGTYDLAVWTELEGDSNPSNDTAYLTVVNIPTIQNYPYQQNFDSSENDWTVENNSQNPSWALGTPNGFRVTGAYSGSYAWATNLIGPYNSEELSYLISPCMDFSSRTDDPKIAFRLFIDTASDADRLWLEVSTNDGATWSRVLADSIAYNWYNNASETAWTETGGFSDWAYVENVLTGTAGKDKVRLRFVFESGSSESEADGVAIDDLHIFAPTSSNLVALYVANSGLEGCGIPEDRVSIQVYNAGIDTLTRFNINYQINGGTIFREAIDSILVPGTSKTFQFQTPFNSSDSGNYTITAWTSDAEDAVAISDTTHFTFVVDPPLALPLIEDFEDGEVEEGWLALAGVPAIYAPGDHNNDSYILADNMWFGNSELEFITANYGPIHAEDSLSFDYRFTFWEEGTIPLELDGDQLEIGISTDCGQTFTPIWFISEFNHAPTADFTNVKISLSEYAGSSVRFRVFLQRGGGDYWFDMDNIAILSCPENLGLSAVVTHLSSPEAQDGSIKITPIRGAGHYTYEWVGDTATTDSISNLSSGIYKVIVTDTIVSCIDSLEVEVGFFTAIKKPETIKSIHIFPNPATSLIHIELALQSAMSIDIQVLNAVGQVLLRDHPSKTQKTTRTLNIEDFAPGIYFIKIQIGETVFVKKWVKADG